MKSKVKMKNILNEIKVLLTCPDSALLIKDGTVVKRKGSASGSLLREVNDLVQKHKIKSGLITFNKSSKTLTLSGENPENLKQGFRNVWSSNFRR